MKKKKIALLVIAAGSSSRLGRAKQLLPYRDSFLLQYIIEECLASEIGEVMVVLGANQAQIAPRIAPLDCTICYNPDWAEGMGTSIAAGIAALNPNDYQGAIIVLSDQPFFARNLLHSLLEKQTETQAPIVVAQYAKGMGPPAFFEGTLFPELCKLKGDVGAKPVVKQHIDKVAFVSFPKGDLDIDTEADLIHLGNSQE